MTEFLSDLALAKDRKERSLRRARLARMVTLLNSPQSVPVSVASDDPLLAAARACARGDIAQPDAAVFSAERLVCCADGRLIAAGILDAQGVGHRTARNWYLAEFASTGALCHVEI